MAPGLVDLQSVYDRWMAEQEKPRILEAGCGSSSKLDMGEKAHVVGLDISQKQLERNDVVCEKIVGDLQSYDLPEGSFDAVVCWDVLEHLPHPERAVDHMLRSVKPDGIVVLGLPNLLSIKGLITKFTPHWFHVWVYRNLLGKKDAGKEDTAPFRTFLRFSIAPPMLRLYARRLGFEVVHDRLYSSNFQNTLFRRKPVVRALMSAANGIVKALTLGRIDGTLSDCVLIMRRAVPAPAPVALRHARVPQGGA